MKRLVVNQITRQIVLTNLKDLGCGKFQSIGKAEDYTDEAIRAVFEWFMLYVKETGDKPYQVDYEGIGYILAMVKKKDTADGE
ncbi:hypothetical protein AGMMS49975_21160 [Clostridia bacterium]|nr:hypothetical protein AGMMS49975_21160 [Clostridia bacterium]